MDWTQLKPNEIASLLGGLAGVAALGFRLIEVWRATHVAQQGNVLGAWNDLCERLQAQITANEQRLATLRAELQEIKRQHEADREAWQRKRTEMEQRILELENENAKLRERLDEMQQQRTP